MPKSAAKAAKDKLAVDGTAKLAAKSKASDKHEKSNMTIEEATVASPRASRKRAGEFFDFDEDQIAGDAAEGQSSTKKSATKAEKPAKRAKTESDATAKKAPKAKKTESADKKADSSKKTKSKQADAAKDDTAIEGDPKPKKAKAVKASKTAEKTANEEPKKESKKAAPKEKAAKTKDTKASGETKAKPASKKSSASKKEESAPIAPDTAMDETPFDHLLDSEKDKEVVGKKDIKVAAKASKPKSEAKKATKDAPKAKAAKDSGDAPAKKTKKASKAEENKPDIPDQAVKPNDVVKVTAAPSGGKKLDAPKSKKRKASSSDETAKSGVLESESAKKKQKTSRKSLGESAREFLTSSFEAASDAVRGSIGGLGFGSGADGKIDTTQPGMTQGTDTSPAQPTDSEASDDSDAEPDDQTAALLAGFESDGDDATAGGGSGAGFDQGQKIPALPDAKKTSKKLKAIVSKKDKGGDSGPGVVYVGRIPHGFYEHEMRAYFSQFGSVTRLRLSRSRKTGHSKHYAFIEFADADVAKIVADTMDNYLMFGHILKCKKIAPGDVHEAMWKGANTRFKAVPWNRIEGRKLAMPVGREQWKKREEKETARRASRAQKLLETVGYAFQGTGLKSVDDLPKRETGDSNLVLTSASNDADADDKDVVQAEKSLVTAKATDGAKATDKASAVVVSEEVTTTTTTAKAKKGKAKAKSKSEANKSKA